MDSAKDMILFASKGCIACHTTNGIGRDLHLASTRTPKPLG
jgi:hypothetical protein